MKIVAIRKERTGRVVVAVLIIEVFVMVAIISYTWVLLRHIKDVSVFYIH